MALLRDNVKAKAEQKRPRPFVSFSLQLLHLLLSSAPYQRLGWTKGPRTGAKGRMSRVTLNPPAKPVGHFVSAVGTKERPLTLARQPPCSWLEAKFSESLKGYLVAASQS